MKTLFDLKEYGIEMTDVILTDMVVQGDEVTKNRIYNVMENWFISKFGKKELGIGNVLAVKVDGIIRELESSKIVVPHGNMYALTRKGIVAQKIGYKRTIAKDKSFLDLIKNIYTLMTAIHGITKATLSLLAAALLVLCALGLLSLPSTTIEVLQSLL